MPPKIDQAFSAEVSRLHATKLDIAGIATATGRKHALVAAYLRRLKLPPNRPSRFLNQYDGFFASIDTWAKAYALGFIYADGCVTRNTLEVSVNPIDVSVLEYLKLQMGSDSPILPHEQDGVKSLRFRPAGRAMVADLIGQGASQRKSLILQWPTGVPDHLIWAFLLGHFDGDGSVGMYPSRPYLGRTRTGPTPYWAAVTVVGSWPFSRALSEFLRNNGIETTVSVAGKSMVARVRAQSHKQCSAWLRVMYEGHEFCLARKHEIALRVLNYQPMKRGPRKKPVRAS